MSNHHSQFLVNAILTNESVENHKQFICEFSNKILNKDYTEAIKGLVYAYTETNYENCKVISAYELSTEEYEKIIKTVPLLNMSLLKIILRNRKNEDLVKRGFKPKTNENRIRNNNMLKA